MGLFDRIRGALLGQPFELTSLSGAGLSITAEEVRASRREAADSRAVEARMQETIALGGGLVLDPDDPIFRRIGGNRLKNRDLMPLQQDRMLEISWYLWESNGLAKRLMQLMTDLIVGEGITVEAKDTRLQEQIDAVWNHRVNQLHRRCREFHNSLGVNGELVLPIARNPITGRPVMGFIDPYQIQRVEPDPDNILVIKQIVLKPDKYVTATGGAMLGGETLQVINENPETGLLEGDCFYFSINKLPNSLRGRSDYLAIADWLDLYDQFMFASVERFQFLSAFVWDLMVTGGDEAKIKDALKRFPRNPKPGQVYAHNEHEVLTPKNPDLKASDTSNAAEMLLIHAGGTFGFPTSYLGVTNSNNATIQGQNDVMMKTPSARQKEFMAFITDLVRYALEGVLGANPSLYRGADAGFTVRMPEIAAKDVARIGSTINQLVAANDTAVANETLSRRGAIVLQAAVYKHLGVEFNPADMQNEIALEVQTRKEQDIENQAIAAAAREKALKAAGALPPDDPTLAAPTDANGLPTGTPAPATPPPQPSTATMNG